MRFATAISAAVALVLGLQPALALEVGLDPAEGVIDGEAALALYPLWMDGKEATEVLDSGDCRAFLREKSSYEVFERDCGVWFRLPAGFYEYWIEKPWRISPYTRYLSHTGVFEGKGMIGGAPVGPAGRVVLPITIDPLKHETRVLAAGIPAVDGLLRRFIYREVNAAGVLMPAGPAIALARDPDTKAYQLLSRPFEVVAGKTVTPDLEAAPQSAAHLVAQIARAREYPAETVEAGKADLRLASEGSPRSIEPDVKFFDAERIVGVWYDLEPGDYSLVASAEGFTLPEAVPLKLVGGEIGKVTGRLEPIQPGPKLTVGVVLPSGLDDQEARLDVALREPQKTLRSVAVTGDRQWYEFDGLALGALRLELNTALGPFVEWVEFQSDTLVMVEPEVIEISGQVQYGDDEVAAELVFTTTTRNEIRTKSDASGSFQLASLEALRAVAVEVASGVLYEEIFWHALRESQRIELKVSTTEIEVEVTDSVTGQPVKDAVVTGTNLFDEQELMRSEPTDTKGLASFAALRPGKLEITAEADGYIPMGSPQSFEVRDGDSRRVAVQLLPEGPEAAVTLLLPSGQPADGAEIALVDPAGSILGQARTGPDGEASLAAEAPPGSLLLIRHRQAAFAFRPWVGSDEVNVQLVPAAAPLRLRVMDPWGERPVAHARLGVWIGDMFLTGRRLDWLTGGHGLASSAGYWSVDTMPAQAVGLVAWRSGSEQGAEMARTRSLAEHVEPPWPEGLSIRTVTE